MSRSVPVSRQLSPIRSTNGNGNNHHHTNGYASSLNGYTSSRARTPVAEFIDPTEHPALNEGGVAVITGGASGIGLAAAVQLAGMGLRIVLADVDEAKLEVARKKIVGIVGDANVITVITDVSKLEDVKALKERALDTFGEVSVLLNNAGIALKGTSFGEMENWKKVQYMFERVRLGDFYIVVPDNETSPELDRLRMRWGAEDVSENRPALSRWHPEWKARFDEYIRDGMTEDYRRRTSRVRGVVSITEGDAGVEVKQNPNKTKIKTQYKAIVTSRIWTIEPSWRTLRVSRAFSMESQLVDPEFSYIRHETTVTRLDMLRALGKDEPHE
ncbi:hypothetical protein M408DRAFT_7841 [Serendipita vermifera MAFF 305830]|uniref:Uncharacterized protein n=1 Tax=Serendipita vermifera MAFF 305830 TaxID=933852 RepID=A0A0C3AZF6_SERVB|nr:hypothetical protein M408DRAFT_7841 [Serendipita vermifera MAFF 305830]